MEIEIFNGMGDFVYIPLKSGVSSPMFDTSEEAWDYAEKDGIEFVAEKKRDASSRIEGVFTTLAKRQEDLDELVDAKIISVDKAIEDFSVTLGISKKCGLITEGERKRLFSSYNTEMRRRSARKSALDSALAALEAVLESESVKKPDARYDTTYGGACAFAKYLDARRIPYEFNEGKSFLDAIIVVPAEYDDEGVKNAFACIQK